MPAPPRQKIANKFFCGVLFATIYPLLHELPLNCYILVRTVSNSSNSIVQCWGQNFSRRLNIGCCYTKWCNIPSQSDENLFYSFFSFYTIKLETSHQLEIIFNCKWQELSLSQREHSERAPAIIRMCKKSMQNWDFVGMHCAATRMHCAMTGMHCTLVVPCFKVNRQNTKGNLSLAFFLLIFEQNLYLSVWGI